MATTWKTILILCILIHVYLVIGMVAFHFLEMEHEETTRIDTHKFKERILSNLTCMDEDSLEELIAVIAKAIDNGVNPAKSNATTPSNWHYHGAFFFSGTVITTIGYGHISPNTRGGRGFCVVYALIGIPLCGFLLSALGGRFCQWKNVLQQKVNKKITTNWKQTAISFALTVGLGLVFVVFIPALIFIVTEGWLWRDAVYYSFMTLTTVGFGDYIAGHNVDNYYPDIYIVAVLYWIIVGLSYIALVIQDISKAMSTSGQKVQEQGDNVLVAIENLQKNETNNNTKNAKISLSHSARGGIN